MKIAAFYRLFLVLGILICPLMHATFSSTPTNSINFSGKLIDLQGYELFVTHLRLARAKDDPGKNKQITMYVKPLDPASFSVLENEYTLLIEPSTKLREYFVDFDEVKSIEVPEPNKVWNYQPDKKGYKIQYIEVLVQEKKSTQPQAMLLELGRNDSKHPLKVFFSQINPPLETIHDADTPFCKGIEKSELHEGGIPLQALKKIEILGYCHEVPIDKKSDKNNEAK